MITYKNGDLLESNCNFICHQVNCQGVMGSGIAKQIRNLFPFVYEDYKGKFAGLEKDRWYNLMGEAQEVRIDNDKWIINMFAQFHYLPRGERHTNYIYFRAAVQHLKHKVIHHCCMRNLAFNEFTIGFPDHIGCGLGGGYWNVVKKIIEEEFAGDEWKVEIWKLN